MEKIWNLHFRTFQVENLIRSFILLDSIRNSQIDFPSKVLFCSYTNKFLKKTHKIFHSFKLKFDIPDDFSSGVWVWVGLKLISNPQIWISNNFTTFWKRNLSFINFRQKNTILKTVDAIVKYFTIFSPSFVPRQYVDKMTFQSYFSWQFPTKIDFSFLLLMV